MSRVSASSSSRNQYPQQNATLLDCNSMLEAGDAIAATEGVERVPVEYPKLPDVTQAWRNQQGWKAASAIIALVSADTKSEGQQRFITMLNRSGFETDVSPYRDNFVSMPAGRQPTDQYDKDRPQKPLVSMASRLTYALGLLANYPEPQVLIVSHSFELCWPMLNFKQRNQNARVGLAFFGGLLDFRWKHAGLFEKDGPISFFNIEEVSTQILGGIDLSSRGRGISAGGAVHQTGIGRF